LKPEFELTWFQVGAAALAWLIVCIVIVFSLSGCARNDHMREPYDPKHSAADRYGQRSKTVDGLFWRDICEGAGGEWSNGPNGTCSVYPFQRPSIGEPTG